VNGLVLFPSALTSDVQDRGGMVYADKSTRTLKCFCQFSGAGDLCIKILDVNRYSLVFLTEGTNPNLMPVYLNQLAHYLHTAHKH